VTLLAVSTATYAPVGVADSYAVALLAAFIEADAKLQRHRGDCSKMLKHDLRFARIENSLKLRLCLAEARLVDEVEAHGGTMTIGGRIATVGWATLASDLRRRKWITLK